MRNESEMEEPEAWPSTATPEPYVAIPRLSVEAPVFGRRQLMWAALRTNRRTQVAAAVLAIAVVVVAVVVLRAVLG